MGYSGKLRRNFMLIILVLMLSACSTFRHGATIPEPNLSSGWYPTKEMGEQGLRLEMEINGKVENVKCMTVEDIELVDKYMKLLQINEEVSK